MTKPMYCFWSDSLVDADNYVPHIDEFLTPYDVIFDIEDAALEDALFTDDAPATFDLLAIVKNLKKEMAIRAQRAREERQRKNRLYVAEFFALTLGRNPVKISITSNN